MTIIYDGVKVFTYEEWRKTEAAEELLGEIEECDTCNGTGEHECECGNTHECGACDGSGMAMDIRNVYETMLREEINKLIAWRDGLAIKHPSLMGEKRQRLSMYAAQIIIRGNARSA
jgi:hypothetical protein